MGVFPTFGGLGPAPYVEMNFMTKIFIPLVEPFQTLYYLEAWSRPQMYTYLPLLPKFNGHIWYLNLNFWLKLCCFNKVEVNARYYRI